ncbi:probable polygalacturonase At3g15720 [Vigna radiata var. radiata]|uniref:Probable polygalacturonase At3g15720 n=1 Tax=Vigna radiata var. radiata TaxID=3916 RepID=A0A3Q0FC27_VIGRR|nr:probable polygalacturonase At3g15720 [Vigna radiata var. radiata]
MQRLITRVLILCFISQCLCDISMVESENTIYDVRNYGANGNGKSDDSNAFMDAWNDICGRQGTPTLLIPENRVFLVKRNIIMKGPCKATNINIQLQGRIVAPQKNAWEGDKSTMIYFTNINGLRIVGKGGSIDGFGSSWWPCKNCPRPAVIGFNACNDLSVSYLSITNSPQAHITINGCKDAIFSHVSIRSPADSPNTDGIDISSSKNIFIKDSNIASGDDCIAIIGDSSYINATGIACGPGHGISIGSLGRNNDNVEQVRVYNSSFTKTTNGARIKTFSGGSGYARRITFEKITLNQVYNPIIIDQHYNNIMVTFRGFRGTSANDRAIDLACGSPGCFNILLDEIKIVSSQPGKPASCSCTNVHGRSTSTIPNCNY